MRLLASVLTGAMLMVASSAQADWQYTKWGMTPEEVVAASDGQAFIPEGPEQSAPNFFHGASAKYKVNDMHFEVQFMFERKTRALNVVRLIYPEKSACYMVQYALEQAYGPADKYNKSAALGERWDWWDRKHKNVVSLIVENSVACSVAYREWKEAGADGGL